MAKAKKKTPAKPSPDLKPSKKRAEGYWRGRLLDALSGLVGELEKEVDRLTAWRINAQQELKDLRREVDDLHREVEALSKGAEDA